MRFQSENAVFKFLWHSVDGGRNLRGNQARLPAAVRERSPRTSPRHERAAEIEPRGNYVAPSFLF